MPRTKVKFDVVNGLLYVAMRWANDVNNLGYDQLRTLTEGLRGLADYEDEEDIGEILRALAAAVQIIKEREDATD